MSQSLKPNLYNKLWDNINVKETRVWTFLSFYGAIIALVASSKVTGPSIFFVLLFLVILSFWGAMFVVSAEWWSVRNRLMISAIEDTSTSIISYIPKLYKTPRFTIETLSNFTLMIMTVLSVFFSITLVLLFNSEFSSENFYSLEFFKKNNNVSLIISPSLLTGIVQGAGVILAAYPFVFREAKSDEYWVLVNDYVDEWRPKKGKRSFFVLDHTELQKRRYEAVRDFDAKPSILIIWSLIIVVPELIIGGDTVDLMQSALIAAAISLASISIWCHRSRGSATDAKPELVSELALSLETIAKLGFLMLAVISIAYDVL